MPPQRLNTNALIAAAIYLLIGGTWITVSDEVLALMVSDPVRLTAYQTYKGWAFVAVMSALAYVLIARIDRQLAAIRASEHRLVESENRFRQMAEYINQIFFLATPDYSEFFYVSPAYAQIWGRGVASLSAAPDSWLAGVHPDDRARVQAVVANGIGSGGYEAEYRVVRPDGSQRWVHSRAFELNDENGKPFRVAGIVDDVTDRKRAEVEVLALNETLEKRVAERTAALQQANDDLESFSFSVSHDLRAPLRALNGFAHLVSDNEGARIGEDSRRMLDRICVNAEKMGAMIDDILAFSRIGREEMRHDVVGMDALAREVAEELRPEYPAARIEIDTLPDAVGDAAMLRRVWSNLIGNALKFSSHRGAPCVTIAVEAMDGTTGYVVRDNGAGFDMASAGHLFGVFQRMHRAEEFPGTGAGLAIVKRILERHGGRIRAEAVPDGGATFRFTVGSREPA